MVLRMTTVWRALLLLSAWPICSQIRRIYRRSRLPLAWLGVPTQTKDSSVSRIAFDGIAGSAQPARLDGGGYDFADVCFNDGRLPTVDQVDFGRERIDSDDFMAVIGEASRRNGSDITQSKNADSQNAYLSLMLSGLEIVIC